MINDVVERKTFILDTSVLLYDAKSIHSFPGNDVIIPIVVLDELDRNKERRGLVGENARYVNRYLDNLRKKGSLHQGIMIEDIAQSVRVELSGFDDVPIGLDPEDADNRIISSALQYARREKNAIMVTKDINFRVKCDALGIKSEDYYKDKIIETVDESYRGYVDVEVFDASIIDRLYTEAGTNEDIKILEEAARRQFYQNEFVCVKCGSRSFLGIYSGSSLFRLLSDNEINDGFVGVSAKNREQLYALNALLDDNIPLVTITGIAGSGKTFITLMTAIADLNSKKFDRIVITRNIQPVGKDIGFLPGAMNDKMMPWMSPIIDNFRQAFKDKDLSYFKMMREKGMIEIAPLSYMRGRTFNNTFLIMDEAQNASIHEIKTVITRIGEGSKIVLLGDIDQIDTPYIDSLSNGLTIVSEKFKNEKVAAHVKLKKGERSYLSAVAAKLL